MKTDLFQSCGHCWVFQICWHIECSTFTASSFRVWNSSTGMPSPPLALFVVMLSKARLTSHSRMSGSRWVITPLCDVDVHSCHLLFDHFHFALIHGPNIPGSYNILLFTALNHASITSSIHNWVLFLLWLRLFILSGVISPLISSSILGIYWLGELIFQCLIFLPFHTVHAVLKARILKWFAIPFSSGPCFVRTLHHDSSILGDPTWHGSYFH